MMESVETVQLSNEDYRALPGLSYSGLKDLAISPMRYWAKHVDPERVKPEPTPEMQFGSALHCAILEPSKFGDRYACELIPPDNCLDTMEELRTFLKNCGVTPKGTRKADVIAQVQAFAPEVAILDVIQKEHLAENVGKVIFKAEDWQRLKGAVNALGEEPHVNQILSEGQAEVALFSVDEETGVRLKGKVDWLTPKLNLDLKTFTQKRGRDIDRSITDAIFYEKYYMQAFFYALLRGWPKEFDGTTVIPFVESDAPNEVRIRRLQPKSAFQPNAYWTRALLEVRGLIRTYAECVAQFGERPWKYAQEISSLVDEEMPQLAY